MWRCTFIGPVRLMVVTRFVATGTVTTTRSSSVIRWIASGEHAGQFLNLGVGRGVLERRRGAGNFLLQRNPPSGCVGGNGEEVVRGLLYRSDRQIRRFTANTVSGKGATS